jgi:hypothetical protein
MRNSHKILIVKAEGTRSLGDLGMYMENNIKNRV